MKGRKIYGDLVPFGQVWRTGANEATTFVTSSDVVVGGKNVPAGSYTIFTVPNADKWTLIINKKTGEWGIPYKYESDELARVDMKISKLPAPVENFTARVSHFLELRNPFLPFPFPSLSLSFPFPFPFFQRGGAPG